MSGKFNQKAIEVLNEGVKKHGSMNKFATAVGTSVANISRWASGKQSPRLSDLSPIMDKLGVNIVPPDEEVDSFELVPKVKAMAGAGSSLITDGEIEGHYAFKKSWLNTVNIGSTGFVMMDVLGDSMQPLIQQGDTILVDQSDTQPQDGKIYVVGLDEELLVKRLQKISGGWLLVSQNPEFHPIKVSLGEQENNFRIYGRVRWFGRMLD